MRIEYLLVKENLQLFVKTGEVSTADAGSSTRIYLQELGSSGLEQEINPSLRVIKVFILGVYEIQAYSSPNETIYRLFMYQ